MEIILPIENGYGLVFIIELGKIVIQVSVFIILPVSVWYFWSVIVIIVVILIARDKEQ